MKTTRFFSTAAFFAALMSAGSAYAQQYPCKDSQNRTLYCNWNSGCYAIDPRYADPPGGTCESHIANCQKYGALFVGVTKEGAGINCSKVGGTQASNTFTDSRDNAVYKTVKIGTQTWMAQNLNYNATGSKCYDNNPANCKKYGRLYDWKTAMSLNASCNSSGCASQISAKHSGICPSGWHLPSKAEWTTLRAFVGDSVKLKAKTGWNSGKNGTDIYGFAALPGGSYSPRIDGGFNVIGWDFEGEGSFGRWWATDEYDGNFSEFYARIWNGDFDPKSKYLSVRCVKN